MSGYGKLKEDGYLMSSNGVHKDFEELSNFTHDKNGKFYEYYKLKKENNKYVPDFKKIKEKQNEKKEIEELNRLNRKVEFNTHFPLGLVESPIDNIKDYICPKCRKYKNANRNMFGSDILRDIYALRNNISCLKCNSNSIINEQNKILQVLIKNISINAFNYIYLILGSQSSIGNIIMKENQINDIYLEEMYIPKNAKILDINLTPSCHLFPLKLMSNNTRFTHDIKDSVFSFFPANIFNQLKSSNKNELSIMVQWILFDEKNIVNYNLLQAINNYIDNNPLELIMNANRILELSCTQICYKAFKNNESKYTHLNKPLRKNISKIVQKEYVPFGIILNHLLIEICQQNKITEINTCLLKCINDIKDLRNTIAHQGQLDKNKKLTNKGKVEILAISILGSSLMQYINKRI